jgi:Cof subfamily protein (haloacid dehalogenase superfamily)
MATSVTLALGQAACSGHPQAGENVDMRMVACDLDGTIVGVDGKITARTLAALSECERLGIHVVFVTGRPPRWMGSIVEMTGHQGLALCGNGAVVLNLATNEVVSSRGLSAETVLETTARLRRHIPGIAFALETLNGYRREADYLPLHQAALEAPTGTLDEHLVDRPIVIKLLCRQAQPHYGSLDSDAMLAIARRELAGMVEVVHSDPASCLLEISAPGVTKATALAWLADSLDVPAAEVVAFGDMPNDVPMLSWVGSGYAMADGHPEAIAAAPFQAPPCAEDGVAQILEGLLVGHPAVGADGRTTRI